MPFRVHLQEVDARDVLSLEYFGKRRGIDRLFRDMARMERGQPTDPAALIRPIESKPGADAVTDSTLVQAYQRLRGAVLLEPLFEEGPVAVIGLECEDFPPLLNERKQCMAMVGADDRKSVVYGKNVYGRVDPGCRRTFKKK